MLEFLRVKWSHMIDVFAVGEAGAMQFIGTVWPCEKMDCEYGWHSSASRIKHGYYTKNRAVERLVEQQLERVERVA